MDGTIAQLLRVNKEQILCAWEKRSLREVESAGTVVPLALRDSIPLYLDHLAETLATSKRMDFIAVNNLDNEARRLGRLHGADRAKSKNYDLSEVIFEYHILREVIFGVLEPIHALSTLDRDIILDSIEQAVNHSAVEFSNSHHDIQQMFVNTLTHDLKNPITTAKLSAQLILRRNDVPAPARDSSRRILGSMSRLESMIQDLLDTSRVRAGQNLELKLIECDLSSSLSEVVEEMNFVYGDRIIFTADTKCSGSWPADGLRRAVENLIGNAVKYGTPLTPILIDLHGTPEGIRVTVSNEGKPISKEEIPNLFQQFKRLRSADDGSKTGWGLGLTLVKAVVDACHGKITVKSEPRTGTQFILDIPNHK